MDTQSKTFDINFDRKLDIILYYKKHIEIKQVHLYLIEYE